jgi:hypothetical protein
MYDDENTPHFSSYINSDQTAKSTPKVDMVIIYALNRLTLIVSEPYDTETQRMYKYYQARDLIQIVLDPLIAPKIRDTKHKDWVLRYKEYMDDLKRDDRLEENLEYFSDTLQKMMRLIATVLYSNGYYFTEVINDKEYVEMMSNGGIVGSL